MNETPKPPGEEPEGAARRIVSLVRRGFPRPRSPAAFRDDLETAYAELQEMDVRLNDRRTLEDIRRRADGQPSAVPPHPTLPLRNWATVQGDAVGEEYESVADRLLAYESWLRGLKRHGLYSGETTLKREPATSPDDATGGATSAAS